MEDDNSSDSDICRIEEIKHELAQVNQTLASHDNQLQAIHESIYHLNAVHAIQESLSAGRDNIIADQIIQQHEENPSNNNCWNIENIEGTLEFGDDGLITAKGSDGLVRAKESLPINTEHGIMYFELKIIDIPPECGLLIGIIQKTMAMSSFYVFKAAYSYNNHWVEHIKDQVIGCGVKIQAGKMFITRNGMPEKNVELAELKYGDGVDQKLAIKLVGEGCSLKLGRVEMSDAEDNCPF